MGQYYYPMNLEKSETLCSHDYNRNGLKLMEHSYLHNVFVGVVMNLLRPKGSWYKNQIIWCGDYSEMKIKDLKENKMNKAHILIHSGDKEIHSLMNDFAGLKGLKPMNNKEQSLAIIINHTTKEFIKAKGQPKDSYDNRINPMPLLLSSGNGNGGGDYEGSDMEFVGMWAGDVISVEFKLPEGYQEIHPIFAESR